MTATSLPYENVTAGKSALADIEKILKRFGAATFGVQENWASGDLLVQFEIHGRRIQVKANAYGYAKAWLAANPQKDGKFSRAHQDRATALGQKAVYSIVRDWIKSQLTAIEVGMLTPDQAFLPNIVLDSGETVMELIEGRKILPALEAPR